LVVPLSGAKWALLNLITISPPVWPLSLDDEEAPYAIEAIDDSNSPLPVIPIEIRATTKNEH